MFVFALRKKRGNRSNQLNRGCCRVFFGYPLFLGESFCLFRLHVLSHKRSLGYLLYKTGEGGDNHLSPLSFRPKWLEPKLAKACSHGKNL